jgi:hypothetical protein
MFVHAKAVGVLDATMATMGLLTVLFYFPLSSGYYNPGS